MLHSKTHKAFWIDTAVQNCTQFNTYNQNIVSINGYYNYNYY